MMIKWSGRITSVALGLVAFTAAKAQQDACVALLQHGIYASHVTETSQQSYSEYKSNFCSWYSSYRESHSGGSAGIQIPIADIPVGFSGSMTYGEADALNKAICTADYSQGANNQSFVDASHYIDPNGAAAFAACATAEGGGLRLQTNINDNETAAVIAIAYQPSLGQGPATVQRVDTPGWKCIKPDSGGISIQDIVGKQGRLGSQQYSIVCERTVFDTPKTVGGLQVVSDQATINIGTTAGSFIQQFRPVLYRDPLADTAKVMASYPKGTILPFAGRSEDIPAGWHMCDGHLGTVDLVDRAPFGTIAPDKIGTEDGQMTHTHKFTQGQQTGSESNGGGHRIDPNCCAGDSVANSGHKHSLTGVETDPTSSLPPITRVYFIQKIN
jgi:hypothetical protein